jgi:hypothetical protein
MELQFNCISILLGLLRALYDLNNSVVVSEYERTRLPAGGNLQDQNPQWEKCERLGF